MWALPSTPTRRLFGCRRPSLTLWMHNDRALDAGAVSSSTVFYGYLPISVAVRAVWAAQALCTLVSEWACGAAV